MSISSTSCIYFLTVPRYQTVVWCTVKKWLAKCATHSGLQLWRFKSHSQLLLNKLSFPSLKKNSLHLGKTMSHLKNFINYSSEQLLIFKNYMQEVYFKNRFSKGKGISALWGKLGRNRGKRDFWKEHTYFETVYFKQQRGKWWKSHCEPRDYISDIYLSVYTSNLRIFVMGDPFSRRNIWSKNSLAT